MMALVARCVVIAIAALLLLSPVLAKGFTPRCPVANANCTPTALDEYVALSDDTFSWTNLGEIDTNFGGKVRPGVVVCVVRFCARTPRARSVRSALACQSFAPCLLDESISFAPSRILCACLR